MANLTLSQSIAMPRVTTDKGEVGSSILPRPTNQHPGLLPSKGVSIKCLLDVNTLVALGSSHLNPVARRSHPAGST